MILKVLRRLSPRWGGAGPDTVEEVPPPATVSSAPISPMARRQRLAEVFTPTRPQFVDGIRPTPQVSGADGVRRLIGRDLELARILQALREDRSHVVLYGERARGKTSLANLTVDEVRRQGFPVARFVCSAASDLDAILRGLARDLSPRSLGIPAAAAAGIGGEGEAAAPPRGSESLLPPSPLHPGNVLVLAPRLKGARLLLVVDEFDRIADEATRTGLADAIKQISDRGAPISFMIIGVSDSLEHLLGRHPSIQRCVTPVPLPLLTNADIESIVASGGRQAGLDYAPAVRAGIAALSRGVPYVAQLLSLRAGQAALDRGQIRVGGAELAAAITAAVREVDPRVVVLYETLLGGGTDAAATAALLRAAAGGVQDEFGRFRAVADSSARGGGSLRVAGVPAEPKVWRRLLEAGAIRACVGAGPNVFTFGEAMLSHYVLLRAIHDAVLRPGDVRVGT